MHKGVEGHIHGAWRALLRHLVFFFFSNFSAMLSGMWDLSFLTRDRTCTSCIWKRGDLTTEPPGKSLRHLVFTSRAAGRHRKHLSKKVMCILHHFSPVQLFVTLWTVAQQTPLSMGTLQARILEWVARPLLQGIFPTQGSNPCLLRLLHWQASCLLLVPAGKMLLAHEY